MIDYKYKKEELQREKGLMATKAKD